MAWYVRRPLRSAPSQGLCFWSNEVGLAQAKALEITSCFYMRHIAEASFS
ncbi:hypothetical protein SETIT_1G085200v2 [Setaria italica]|uniref:Uncharacterized protein n=1 Tax=Setaria italica TaxID=4555 RepID=A0A368PJ54_SETIT|nr:hypothetical protein SETIT_1G085200v2 [Setaria italica]